MWFNRPRWARLVLAVFICTMAGACAGEFSEATGCIDWADSQVPYRTIKIGDGPTRIKAANDVGAIAGQYTADGPTSTNSDRTRGFYLSPDGELALFSVGGSTTLVGAMNASGEIAGRTGYGGSTSTGFVRSPDGEVREFSLASRNATVWSITEGGEVVGSHSVHQLWSAAFLNAIRSGDTQLPFDGYDEQLLLGENEPILVATNDLGWAAGNVDRPGHHWEGFVSDPTGSLTLLRVEDSDTIVTDMNSAGDIVGHYFVESTGQNRGFKFTAGGDVTTFDVGGEDTWPSAINNAGEIAGSYRNQNLPDQGHRPTSGFFRESNGDINTILLPEATSMTVSDLTDAGVIVGYTAPPRLGLANEVTFIIDTQQGCSAI